MMTILLEHFKREYVSMFKSYMLATKTPHNRIMMRLFCFFMFLLIGSYVLLQNLKSNLTLWKLGTLPPALIAFRGHLHPIEPSWHMLGLGYQNKTNIENVKKAAVIHYNGQSKPWLEIGFEHLRPFWTKYVNYSSDFIRNCHILE